MTILRLIDMYPFAAFLSADHFYERTRRFSHNTESKPGSDKIASEVPDDDEVV